ncbi:hypothetical protein ACFP51_22955 [Streptomyces pratens]|uniref:Uncharacterized protein n=1 Tax=Streptomyces pratens TaxID=887456 RepID=A0ABW1LZN2_9ACTN
MHGQSRLPPAREFVRDNPDVLGSRPVWVFSVRMPAALRGPWRRMAPKELPAIEEDLPSDLRYRGHRLFSGVVEPNRLPGAGRLVFRLMGGRFGGFRDGEAVDGWTTGTAGELRSDQ